MAAPRPGVRELLDNIWAALGGSGGGGAGTPGASSAASSTDGTTGNITDTTSTQLVAAKGAGVRTYLQTITVQNSHATVSTWVNILDGAVVRMTVYAVALGGGISIPLPKPLRGTANTAWNVQCETTGANVRANAVGYTSTT
jgi:hypothetical protein